MTRFRKDRIDRREVNMKEGVMQMAEGHQLAGGESEPLTAQIGL